MEVVRLNQQLLPYNLSTPILAFPLPRGRNL
jgi:hypothetical protein